MTGIAGAVRVAVSLSVDIVPLRIKLTFDPAGACAGTVNVIGTLSWWRGWACLHGDPHWGVDYAEIDQELGTLFAGRLDHHHLGLGVLLDLRAVWRQGIGRQAEQGCLDHRRANLPPPFFAYERSRHKSPLVQQWVQSTAGRFAGIARFRVTPSPNRHVCGFPWSAYSGKGCQRCPHRV